jgi:hypothetical protein
VADWLDCSVTGWARKTKGTRMIIDWREFKGKSYPPGEAEDALGQKLPAGVVRIDTLTGEAWMVVFDVLGRPVLTAGGRSLAIKKLQFVPPITVWMYL